MGYTPHRICLPQRADAHDRLIRSRELAMQRATFEWVHTPGLPPYCKGVPPSEHFIARQRDRMKWDVMQSVADAALSTVKWLRRNPGKVADYSLFYPLRQKPAVARRWMLDQEFARQRLDGINPFMITAIDRIPEHFPVTDDVVRGVMPDGLGLDRLLGEGRLFLVDYAALAGSPVSIGCFMEPAMALFWLDESDRLMPLAIQLGQSPATAPAIFTPADPWWVWLTARTFVQEADGNHHEIIDHLARTHLVMETFWVSAGRTLAPQHPLHELLAPHFTGTIAINDEARRSMLAPGGPIDVTMAVGSEGAFWLIAQEYANWSFGDWNPRVEMERRAVLDPQRLPGFHYRDDALRLFDVIGNYVRDLLGLFYVGDADVQDDSELQAWIAELVDDGGGRVRGLPLVDGQLRTFADLCDVVQLLMYLVSCEHAAVNNGQYDQFGFIPNTPGALFLPAPRDKTLINEAEFTYYLPMPDGVEEQLGMVSLLAEPTFLPLGAYGDTFFQDDPAARLVIDRFQAALSEIEVEIERRNADLTVPYTYLLPATVGRSIAI
jgi:arachidonate 15-lipoxygenase